MCGICGFLSAPNGPTIEESTLRAMVDALSHRGPDDRGTLLEGGCGLGHARLSIIDLDGGRQPLVNEDETVALTCNGEIYNHHELRKDLRARGHRFRTESDNEVILHLWEESGPDCVNSLRGMFAFVLHDRRREVLFGARDRFGQKPLFYHQGPGGFVFASEIKGLLPHPDVDRVIDLRALDQFLFYQFVPPPLTMFRSVRQLPPAHRFRLQNGTLAIERYWSNRLEPDGTCPEGGHVDRIEEAVVDAVRSHLESDVPVGVFLSGGIDSSLVAAIAAREGPAPLRTFSITFPGHRYDESTFARLASRHIGTDHHEFPFEPGHLGGQVERLARTFDQPLADRAAIPLLALADETAREVKVVLTGDGGDELFAGYEKHRRPARAAALTRAVDAARPRLFAADRLARCGPDPLRLRKLRSRLAYRLLPSQECRYSKSFWEGWLRNALYRPAVAEEVADRFDAIGAPPDDGPEPRDLLNRMLRIDAAAYLSGDLLLKTDYATMSASLEARAPLLDHVLAERAARLPVALKATAGETKVLLRRVAERFLPPELAARPKRGFAVPLGGWFRRELRGWLREQLLGSAVAVPQYFRPDVVERLLDEHVAGRRDHTGRLYCLVVFELWCRHYHPSPP